MHLTAANSSVATRPAPQLSLPPSAITIPEQGLLSTFGWRETEVGLEMLIGACQNAGEWIAVEVRVLVLRSVFCWARTLRNQSHVPDPAALLHFAQNQMDTFNFAFEDLSRRGFVTVTPTDGGYYIAATEKLLHRDSMQRFITR